MVLVLVVFGCLTGATTLVFGFGGGFVTVPVVYAVSTAVSRSEAMHVAVATSAAVMIVNAAIATCAQARSGRLRGDHLRPLVGFITLGAVAGALASNAVSDRALHLLFAAYLVIAIADIALRRGFISRSHDRVAEPEPLGTSRSIVAGTGIGAVAAFLGVGGSVLTVPLLRRRGLSMAESTALANPLGLPVAIAATLTYSLAAPHDSGPLGYVDPIAAVALLAGSLPTMALIRRALPRIPDRAHAIGYPVFLTVVLFAMLATSV
ncbi:sulfite exporter TauE/SafE family protein [Nocardia sp. NPDC052254]|uniref:sulfite exporter TauE/SafE family protein n=1 Tax=Nocardia sp. NPDC052254 TaxID=3155681 RepID=UPI00342D1610